MLCVHTYCEGTNNRLAASNFLMFDEGERYKTDNNYQEECDGAHNFKRRHT